MKSIIKTEKLIEILNENKNKHRNIFLKALEGYRKEAIRLLEEKLERVKNNSFLPKIHIVLPMPEDHTEDYERAIRSLQLDVREEIELEDYEFAQYIMDDWGWKGAWASNTLSYTEMEK